MLSEEISSITTHATFAALEPYLDPDANVSITSGLLSSPFVKNTPGLQANAYYFGKWAEPWLKFVHRSPMLKERWHACGGTWDGKVVVDVGCGPGNLQLNLGDKPEMLIGVDVSAETLKVAEKYGYTPLLADAHKMPLRSEFADIVALNATIHHCDDMETVIAESARLVKSGGILIADHDPQQSAYNFKGPGKWIWNLRMPIYRLMKRGGHRAEDDEQEWAAARRSTIGPATASRQKCSAVYWSPWVLRWPYTRIIIRLEDRSYPDNEAKLTGKCSWHSSPQASILSVLRELSVFWS